ncbi:MAG TPA: formyltransferase [Deltaproteobacteria bacterium]|jgi:methionyl-tRNA formyltransferase|nr:formyltransferase [Deltaproteobacteria bacterium]
MSPVPNSCRILVFGYGEVGYRCLEILLRRGEKVVGVFTHEDDVGENQWFRSVSELAKRSSVPVRKPESLRDEATFEAIRKLAPDLIFSFYYRSLIPGGILALARLGAFNMHGSLLPKYRGRAPVNWAVLNGESETGATLHYMVERADAGDIVDQERVSIGPEDTAFEVMAKVTEAACVILERRLDELKQGCAPRIPQNHALATKFGRRRPEDGRIDWERGAHEIVNLVRAVTRPFPGAFTETDAGRLYVWRARATAASGPPGRVLRCEPLTVAAKSGAVELLEWNLGTDAQACRPPSVGAQLGMLASRTSPEGGGHVAEHTDTRV